MVKVVSLKNFFFMVDKEIRAKEKEKRKAQLSETEGISLSVA